MSLNIFIELLGCYEMCLHFSTIQIQKMNNKIFSFYLLACFLLLTGFAHRIIPQHQPDHHHAGCYLHKHHHNNDDHYRDHDYEKYQQYYYHQRPKTGSFHRNRDSSSSSDSSDRHHYSLENRGEIHQGFRDRSRLYRYAKDFRNFDSSDSSGDFQKRRFEKESSSDSSKQSYVRERSSSSSGENRRTRNELQIARKRREIINQQNQRAEISQIDGAFQEVSLSEVERDSGISQALAFLKGNLNSIFSHAELIAVSRQLVSGYNYRFLFRFEYSTNLFFHYQVIVYCPIKGSSQITFSGFVDLQKPEFHSINVPSSAPYIREIDQKVLAQFFKDRVHQPQLVNLEISLPFYRMIYLLDRETTAEVVLIYDPLVNSINVIDSEISELPVVDIVEDDQPSVNYRNPRFEDSSSDSRRNPPGRFPTEFQSQSSASSASSASIASSASSESSESVASRENRDNYQIPVRFIDNPQPQVPQIDQIEEIEQGRRINFRIKLDDPQIIGSVNSVTDASYLAFVSQSVENLNQELITGVANFLIEKVTIKSDFTIILVNQIRYGIRVVLTLQDSHEIFQSLVEFEREEYRLVLWRQISSISDITLNIFGEYYPIEADRELFLSIVKHEQTLRIFKSVEACHRRVAYDGIYTRFVIETQSSHKYQIQVYSIPEQNYHEVIQYQLIQTGYRVELEQRIQQIPNDSLNFNSARQYVFRNYGAALKDSSLVFLAISTVQTVEYYRMVFLSLSGKYQAILTVRNQQTRIVRWEKLEDGYVELSIETLEKQVGYEVIRQGIDNYVHNRLNFQGTYHHIEIKEVPGVCNFFKFFFDNPTPFTLFYQENQIIQESVVRGIQTIQTVPTSSYYSDRLFAGFNDLKLTNLQYDQTYRSFEALLASSSYAVNGYQEVAAFWLRNPTNLIYKVIYEMRDGLYLATYRYCYLKKQYTLDLFERYTQINEVGSYGWRCSRTGRQGLCLSCQSDDYILTAGRCYSRIEGCNYQVGGVCQICASGYVSCDGSCSRSPEASTVITTQSYSERRVVTTTSTNKVIFTGGNDVNCLKYDGPICSKCAYRFYLRNGICENVPEPCDEFNSRTQQCEKCYTGFYLRNGICVGNDPLCSRYDARGICQQCYEGYRCIEGKCYIESLARQVTNINHDNLCARWDGPHCKQCILGSQMDITGVCQFREPFCQVTDGYGLCQKCDRGYKPVNGKCQRDSY